MKALVEFPFELNIAPYCTPDATLAEAPWTNESTGGPDGVKGANSSAGNGGGGKIRPLSRARGDADANTGGAGAGVGAGAGAGRVKRSAEGGAVRDGSSSAASMLFDLVGVVVHEGRGVGSGHYVAYCYNRVNDCWLCCNDARVSTTTPEAVASVQAYMLIYANRRTTEFVDAQLVGSNLPLDSKLGRVEYIH